MTSVATSILNTERYIVKTLEDDDQPVITFIPFYQPIQRSGIPESVRDVCWAILLRKVSSTPNTWNFSVDILREEYHMLELVYNAEHGKLDDGINENRCELSVVASHIRKVHLAQREYLYTRGIDRGFDIQGMREKDELDVCLICCFVCKKRSCVAKNIPWKHIAYFLYEGMLEFICMGIAKLEELVDSIASSTMEKLTSRSLDGENSAIYEDILHKLNNGSINLKKVLPTWLRTAFACTSLPYPEVARIWDLILVKCEGNRKGDLAQAWIEEICQWAIHFLTSPHHLKGITSTPELKNLGPVL